MAVRKPLRSISGGKAAGHKGPKLKPADIARIQQSNAILSSQAASVQQHAQAHAMEAAKFDAILAGHRALLRSVGLDDTKPIRWDATGQTRYVSAKEYEREEMRRQQAAQEAAAAPGT